MNYAPVYFEKSDVWQEARIFAKELYQTTDAFPEKERFGITNQIPRAALSISANSAEGMARGTNKDKARFLNLAYASAIEVVNFLIISRDLEYLQENGYVQLRTRLEKITNQLNSLQNKVAQGKTEGK